jgi:hypothetical protein
MVHEEKKRQCKACFRPSNNKHFDCPPRMADGRLFTDYSPNCTINNTVPPLHDGFLDSYKYRQYLIKNTDAILGDLRATSYSRAVCAPCAEPHNQAGTMLPEHTLQVCDGRTCKFVLNDPYGLGLGRSYGTTPYKEAKREQFLVAKKKEGDFYKKNANCCSTLRDDLMYNPIDPGIVHRHGTGRLTIPYGGHAMAGGDTVTKRRSVSRSQ